MFLNGEQRQERSSHDNTPDPGNAARSSIDGVTHRQAEGANLV